MEQEFISRSSVSDEVLSRMRSASDWRGRLIVSYMNFFELTSRIKNKAKQTMLVKGMVKGGLFYGLLESGSWIGKGSCSFA